MVRPLIWFSFVLVLLASARVHAQSPSEIAAAKQWFTEGVALEEKGQFAEALERFRRARGVKVTPQILFHVGLCEVKTGALVEGLVDLERAAELGKSEGNDQVVGAAQSEIATLKPRIPSIEIVVTGSERPTRLSLDDKPLADSTLDTAIPVNPGSHVLTATFAAGDTTKRFELEEGKRSRIEIAPPSAAQPATPAPRPTPVTPAPPPTRDKPKSESSVLPWVLIGGGVVAVAGGFYLWKLRGDQIDKLDGICPDPDSCPAARESEVEDLESKGKLYATLGIGAWALGGVALAAGGFLLLGTGPKETGMRVTPALGPRTAGATFGGRF